MTTAVVTHDPYPSRINESASILPRTDPVLWPTTAKGPLFPGQLEKFEQDGFLFLPECFSRNEVAGLLDELEAIRKTADSCQRREIILEPKSGELRSIFAVQTLSDAFDRLSRDPRLLGIARQILGSDVYIHQSRVNLKPGFKGEQFDWHSDFETWHVEDGMPRMRALSISLLLTPNTPYNGPLMLAPASHKSYITCVGQTPENHYKESLRKQQYGVPDHKSLATLISQSGIQAPTGPAGSLLIFDCNTMHGSAGNLSPWPRCNAFFVYNSVHNALGEPFCGRPPRPQYIASRHFDPIS